MCVHATRQRAVSHKLIYVHTYIMYETLITTPTSPNLLHTKIMLTRRLAKKLLHRTHRYMSSLPPHEEIIFPALSPTMETGSIARWVKKEGDQVAEDDVLAEIETDKATVDYQATDDGFLAKILVQEGEPDVNVGSVIGIMVESEDDIAAFADFTPSSSPKQEEQSTETPTPNSSPIQTTTTISSSSSSSSSSGSRVFASPLAKKLVREHGDVPLDLSSIQGTGPHGRVLRDDVLNALENADSMSSTTTTTTSTPAATTAIPVATGGAFLDVEASRVRNIIAQNTTASKQNVPHYYLTVELELDNLLNIRSELNEKTSGDTKLSVNDFIVKASALACKAVCFFSSFLFLSYSYSQHTYTHRFQKLTHLGSRKMMARMSYERTNTSM